MLRNGIARARKVSARGKFRCVQTANTRIRGPISAVVVVLGCCAAPELRARRYRRSRPQEQRGLPAHHARGRNSQSVNGFLRCRTFAESSSCPARASIRLIILCCCCSGSAGRASSGRRTRVTALRAAPAAARSSGPAAAACPPRHLRPAAAAAATAPPAGFCFDANWYVFTFPS